MSKKPSLTDSFGISLSTLAGIGWALCYVDWRIALAGWVIGNGLYLHGQRPRDLKWRFGLLLVSLAPPLIGLGVYYFLSHGA